MTLLHVHLLPTPLQHQKTQGSVRFYSWTMPPTVAPEVHQSSTHTVNRQTLVQGVDPAVHAQAMSRAGYVVGMAAGEVMRTQHEMRQLQSDTVAGVNALRAEGRQIVSFRSRRLPRAVWDAFFGRSCCATAPECVSRSLQDRFGSHLLLRS